MAQVGGKRPGAGRKPGKVSAAKRELASMAKEHAQSALQTLVDIAKDKTASEGARVSAATAILDRGYGRPFQAVQHTGKDGGPIQTEDVNARELIAGRLARLATGGDSEEAS